MVLNLDYAEEISSLDEVETPVNRARSQSESLRRHSLSIASITSHVGSRSLYDFCEFGGRGNGGLENGAFILDEDLEVPKVSALRSDTKTVSYNSTENLEKEEQDGKSGCSSDRYKGITLAIVSTIFMSLSSVSVGLLRGRVSSNEVTFVQMFLQFLFCIPIAALERASLWLPKKALALVLYRSIAGSTCTILAYFAFQAMPIGNAKAIIYSSPVFTALFSCILLHEACTAVDILLSATTLSGVLLVIQPPFMFGGDQTSTTILAPIFCLLVAVIVGTIYISLRKLGLYRVHPSTLLIYLTTVGMIVGVIMTTAFREWVIPRCGMDRILLIITGITSIATQIGLTQALRYEKATTVSLIRTADVVFTFILDYIFFDIIPNAITLTGALMVIGSLVAITLYKMWTDKKKEMNKESDDDQPEGVRGDNLHQDGAADDTSVTENEL